MDEYANRGCLSAVRALSRKLSLRNEKQQGGRCRSFCGKYGAEEFAPDERSDKRHDDGLHCAVASVSGSRRRFSQPAWLAGFPLIWTIRSQQLIESHSAAPTSRGSPTPHFSEWKEIGTVVHRMVTIGLGPDHPQHRNDHRGPGDQGQGAEQQGHFPAEVEQVVGGQGDHAPGRERADGHHSVHHGADFLPFAEMQGQAALEEGSAPLPGIPVGTAGGRTSRPDRASRVAGRRRSRTAAGKNGWQAQAPGQPLTEQGGGTDAAEGEQDSVLVHRGFLVSVAPLVLSRGEPSSHMAPLFPRARGSRPTSCRPA